MGRSIGLLVTDHIAAAAVENGQVCGEIHRIRDEDEPIRAEPVEGIVRLLLAGAEACANGTRLEAIGVALPGIVRGGVIEESPNLPQLKGFNAGQALHQALEERGISAAVGVSNDADAVAAGLAASRGADDRLIRVWTLGEGIGFGHFPASEGVWEGGHTVVSLDPGEHFCACGGRGHLEGIMGHRAMRLRFLDREPEEIFAAAKRHADSSPEPADSSPDPRCVEFVLLWHRALAAATATSIHLEGPGKFYITGANSRFINVGFLNRCVQEMVKLSPLQSYVFEVVPPSDELGILGAALTATASAGRLPSGLV